MPVPRARLDELVAQWNASGDHSDAPVRQVSPHHFLEDNSGDHHQEQQEQQEGAACVSYVSPHRRNMGGDLERYFCCGGDAAGSKDHCVLITCFVGYTHTSSVAGIHDVLRQSLAHRSALENVRANCYHRGLRLSLVEFPHAELPNNKAILSRVEMSELIHSRENCDFESEIRIWRFPRGSEVEFIVSRGEYKNPVRRENFDVGCNCVVFLDEDCPICGEELLDRDARFQCYHSVCNGCASRLHDCPLCRSPARYPQWCPTHIVHTSN